ncbi:MAG: efflux RND transporter periplasmic adaptor subunit [Thermoanaerobaculia bacterium]
MSRRSWIATLLLFAAVLGTAAALAAWKLDSIQDTEAAATSQPEPIESVKAAVARPYEYRPTATSIGTVLARRSITLRNELPGTVAEVMLAPGQIVEAGSVLVRLDVSVEQAELAALEAQAALAETLLDRNRQASETQAVSELEVDRARTELDVALAQIERTKAIIARKTIRARFRARVGLADVHPGQYLDAGTVLTTLQGIDEVVHVDFAVAQRVAEGLAKGDEIEVFLGADESPTTGTIVAVDSRVDPTTRNATVRAQIESTPEAPAPGASVRVQVPAGPTRSAVVVPATALRTESTGDHVFILAADEQGQTRARLRPVESGARLGDQVVIQTGLDAGEQVAASGSFKLRDAVLVAVATDAVAASTLASAAGAK